MKVTFLLELIWRNFLGWRTLRDQIPVQDWISILTQFTNKGPTYEFLYSNSSLLVKCQGMKILPRVGVWFQKIGVWNVNFTKFLKSYSHAWEYKYTPTRESMNYVTRNFRQIDVKSNLDFNFTKKTSFCPKIQVLNHLHGKIALT